MIFITAAITPVKLIAVYFPVPTYCKLKEGKQFYL